MSKNNVFAFLDTNIFLHFQLFTEIAWDKILHAKFVTLVIPPIITKELDKHKYNHRSERVKERAIKVTKRFAELLHSNGEVRPNVRIQFERVQPQSEFKKYNLSKESQDDHLIASIIRFQNESGNKAILVTNDITLKIKAHQLEIEILELEEKYQNKNEENPDKKKIKDLEKELLELKVKIPKLKLVSKEGTEEIIAQTLSAESFVDENFEHELIKIKQQYPLITETYKPKRTIRPIVNGKPYGEEKVEFKLPSGEVKQAGLSIVKKYNKELEEFYKEYEKFLNEKTRINNLRSRTVRLQIKLKNDGNSPAERFHVVLNFPKGFQVTINQDIFSYPNEITPPQLITMADIFGSSFSAGQYPPNYSSLFNPSLPKIEMPWEEVRIKRKDFVYTADFQNIKLSHGYSFDCPKIIYVSFPENQKVKTFQIKYKIAADNLPKAIEGKLKVLIDKNKSEV